MDALLQLEPDGVDERVHEGLEGRVLVIHDRTKAAPHLKQFVVVRVSF